MKRVLTGGSSWFLAVLVALAAPAWAQTIITADTTLPADLFDSVVIAADDVTLDCAGNSIIGFPAGAGITVQSRSGVTIRNCTVTGFLNGIAASAGASLTLVDTAVVGNLLDGLDISDNTHVDITGSFAARNNGVFGVFMINNASATLTGADVLFEGNVGGIQVSLHSSVFVRALAPLPPSTILAQDNQAFGLTVVSSSQLFLFGDVEVTTRRNGSNGVSVFTQSALELDNGPRLVAEDNTANGILLEDATLNVFNMPQNPGSVLTIRRNGFAGLNIGKASVFDMGNDATMQVDANRFGLLADDGSTVRVQQTSITGNVDRDVLLSFGSRGNFSGNTIGSFECDGPVLLRGDANEIDEGVGCRESRMIPAKPKDDA